MSQPVAVQSQSWPGIAWFGVPIIRDPDVGVRLDAIDAKLGTIGQKVDHIMTAIEDFNASVALWVDYANALKATIADLQAQLEASVATVAELIATDAADDAAQAEALTLTLRDQLTAALSAVQNPPEAPPPIEEPPAEEPPVK